MYRPGKATLFCRGFKLSTGIGLEIAGACLKILTLTLRTLEKNRLLFHIWERRTDCCTEPNAQRYAWRSTDYLNCAYVNINQTNWLPKRVDNRLFTDCFLFCSCQVSVYHCHWGLLYAAPLVRLAAGLSLAFLFCQSWQMSNQVMLGQCKQHGNVTSLMKWKRSDASNPKGSKTVFWTAIWIKQQLPPDADCCIQKLSARSSSTVLFNWNSEVQFLKLPPNNGLSVIMS